MPMDSLNLAVNPAVSPAASRIARRRVLQALALTPVWVQSPTVLAQNSDTKTQRYREVKPVQPTENPARIEVVDFFWYGCTHCNTFAAPLAAWKKKLPADVSYRYLPVAFEPRNENHTRLFYTLQALNKVDELHAKVFATLHSGPRQALIKPDEIADFAVAHGIERKLWLDTFNSFSVQTHVKRAQQVWMGYRIEGTPTLGIDGRYWTSPSVAGGSEAALKTADDLIEQLRRQRSGRK